MWESELEQKIRNILEIPVSSLGKEIVLVEYNDRTKTLEIIIEKQNYENVTIEDCEEVSKFVSSILDVTDPEPITSNYFLQVSSPGIERPLTRKKDFQKFKGKKIRVWLKQPILENNKKLTGVIENSNDEYVTLKTQTEMGVVNVPFQAIKKSELVFEDFKSVFNQHNRDKKFSRKTNQTETN